MKKTLLCLVAFLLSVTMVCAQKKFVDGRGLQIKPECKMGHVLKSKAQSAQKSSKLGVANKIAIDADERIVGFYDTEDLDLSGYSSIGLVQYPGNLSVGVLFTPNELMKAVGGEITKVRFGLFTSVGASRVFVGKFDLNAWEPTILSEKEIASTQQGWNDVVLDTPVKIEADETYIIGFDYTQITGNTDQAYPLLTDYKVNDYRSDYGFMAYGNLGTAGVGWYMSSTAQTGNLCIQAVVKGGSFIDKDLTLNSFVTTSRFAEQGGRVYYNLGVKNTGNEDPSSYVIDLTVDGNVVQTLNTPVALSGSNTQLIEGVVTLPADISVGEHNLTATVKQIDGTTPTENIDDDVLSTTVVAYNETKPSQKILVEQFTSTSCGYCPVGYDMLNALNDMRDDMAWVAIHGDMSPYYPDEFTTGEGGYLTFFETGNSWPSASFNRCYINDATINRDGYVGVGIAYSGGTAEQIAQMFNQIIDVYTIVPSFASVNIASSYNSETRSLNVKVSGDAVTNFKEVMGDDAVLSVYLTEDGLSSSQLQYVGQTSQWISNYPHNHVFRCSVTDIWGDKINWSGNSYENEFNITLDEGWNAENMNIVAFISRPIQTETDGEYIYFTSSPEDAFVTNAETVKLGETSTGINTPDVSGEEAVEVARYALDGTQLSVPTKGVNIVKMSDGTTKKVIVK